METKVVYTVKQEEIQDGVMYVTWWQQQRAPNFPILAK